MLETRRYPALEALKEGLIDGTGGEKETLAFVKERKLALKAKSPSYGRIKEELYREVIMDLEEGPEVLEVEAKQDEARTEREKESVGNVKQWEKNIRSSSKL